MLRKYQRFPVAPVHEAGLFLHIPDKSNRCSLFHVDVPAKTLSYRLLVFVFVLNMLAAVPPAGTFPDCSDILPVRTSVRLCRLLSEKFLPLAAFLADPELPAPAMSMHTAVFRQAIRKPLLRWM